jgi:hypothetical protein
MRSVIDIVGSANLIGVASPIIPLTRIKITSGRGVITNTLGFNIIGDDVHTKFFSIIHLTLHLGLVGGTATGTFSIGLSARNKTTNKEQRKELHEARVAPDLDIYCP